MRRRWPLLAGFALGSLAGCSSNDDAPSGQHDAGVVPGDAAADASAYAAPYTLTPFDAVRIASHEDQPNFQGADAQIDLHDGPFAQVTLSVELRSPCFPWSNWQTDKPPAGQNWPADCDAFDRNFEFSLDDPENAGDPPGLELVRSITPFGGPLSYDVDLTDVANGLPGAHRLHALISTWSDGQGQVSGSNGSWFVSAKLAVTPGKAPRSVLAVQSLYYASQSDPAAPALPAIVTPPGTTSARLEYRVTGHGGVAFASGCASSAPAEEFCQREHNLILDETLLADVFPWRSDCAELCTLTPGSPFGDYCDKDPCGAPSSVRAERSNWCPGSVTPPMVWTSDDSAALAAPGDHALRWQLSDVAPGGSWRISATYFAFGP